SQRPSSGMRAMAKTRIMPRVRRRRARGFSARYARAVAPWRRAALVLFGLGCAVLAYVSGDGYLGRMTVHRGFLPVGVADAARLRGPRPRRAVVILADGLRGDAALGLAATRRLAAAGQCRVMDVGAPTLSRPVYTTLSTGLGADRSGVRENDDAAP